jgi:hypothetical protein
MTSGQQDERRLWRVNGQRRGSPCESDVPGAVKLCPAPMLDLDCSRLLGTLVEKAWLQLVVVLLLDEVRDGSFANKPSVPECGVNNARVLEPVCKRRIAFESRAERVQFAKRLDAVAHPDKNGREMGGGDSSCVVEQARLKDHKDARSQS